MAGAFQVLAKIDDREIIEALDRMAIQPPGWLRPSKISVKCCFSQPSSASATRLIRMAGPGNDSG